MVYLEARRIRGQIYWYLVEKQREGDHHVKVLNVYLGTPATLLERLRPGPPSPAGDLRLRSYPFGRAAALLRVAQDLDFLSTVNRHVGKRQYPGFTVGHYLLLTLLARAYEPWSKAATGRWFDRDSFLRFLWRAPSRITSDTILANLRHLSGSAVQKRIERALAQRLVTQGLRPSRLFWDVTNRSNYIEHGETLPTPGHAKDYRYDLNLVSTGLVVTEDHVPLFHETLPGNCDEHDVFARAVESLSVRLIGLELDPTEMVMVMDKGANSEENFAKATELMHVVGSVPSHLVPDLMALPIASFAPLYATGRGTPLVGYRCRRELYGREWNVVMTYNAATSRRKEATYLRYEARYREKMAKLQAGYLRTKGRATTYAGAAASAAALVFPPYRTVFRYTISENPRRFTWEVDAAARGRLFQRFGKRVFFTDLDWDAAKVAQTYEERYKVEQDFAWIKGEEMMPFAPLFVRTDASIRAHAFLIVMGLLLWRLAFRRIRAAGIEASEGEVLEALDELKVALVGERKSGKLRVGRWVLEEHGPLAEQLYRVLQLDEFIPTGRK